MLQYVKAKAPSLRPKLCSKSGGELMCVHRCHIHGGRGWGGPSAVPNLSLLAGE